MDTSKKIKMLVLMEVTIPQALALQSMVEYWNQLAALGASREVAFYADGDGNFRPNATCMFSDPIPELTDELRNLARCSEENSGLDRNDQNQALYDFDAIAWKIGHDDDDGK